MNHKAADPQEHFAPGKLGTIDRRRFVHGLGFGALATLLPSSLGTFAGLFIMPPLGLFVGPFVGALIGELIHGKEIRQAAKVGFGTWLGLVMAIVLKMGLAFAMIGVFAFAWFF